MGEMGRAFCFLDEWNVGQRRGRRDGRCCMLLSPGSPKLASWSKKRNQK